MALQPAQELDILSPDTGAPESELDAVTRSILGLSDPEPEGEQPDPEDSPAEEAPADTEDLDPSDEGEEDDAEEDGADDEDDPQESGDSEEEPDDEFDDEDGDYEEEDEPEAAELIAVKVNGQTHQVTLDELKRNYSGSKRIEADIQEAAEARKVLDERVKEAEHRAQIADQALQVAYTLAMADAEGDPDIDWDALHEIDPNEWAHQRELHRAKQEQANAKIAQVQQAVQAQRAEAEKQQQAAKNEIAAREAKILREAYPVFSDNEAGQARYQELAKFALDRYGKYGLTPEMLGEVQLAVPLIMLNEVYDMVNGKPPTPKKTTRKARRKRTVRPGTGTAQTKTTQSRKSRERLEKRAWESGHVDDVSKTMFEPK